MLKKSIFTNGLRLLDPLYSHVKNKAHLFEFYGFTCQDLFDRSSKACTFFFT